MTSKSWVTVVLLGGVLAVGAFYNRAALRAPLTLDDFAQRAMIEGTLTPSRGPFNLYDFISNDNRAALLERGAIPWWSDGRLVIRFLRPLPSALVWIDHRLFGYGAAAPHILSLLWWVAAVLAAYALYRKAIGPRAALLAALIFALSPTLAIPLVWLANREALITLTFAASALTLYLRWRQDRSRAAGLIAAAAFGASALTGEYALCLVGYLVAFEICHRNEAWRRRLTGLLPAAVPLVLYTIAHAALGYGATASGVYRDPIADPGGYLRGLPRAISVLLGSGWLGMDETSSWFSSSAFRAVLILAGAALVPGTIRSARRSPPGAAPGGGAWLACGSVLALLALAATVPSRRTLGVAALGVSGALGVLIERGARGLRRPLQGSALVGAVVAALIGYVHIVAAPLETRRLSVDAVEAETQNLAQFTVLERQDRPFDTTLLLRANYPPSVVWTPFHLREHAPKRWRVLSYTFESIKAIRTSPSSIEVVEDEAPIFPMGPSDVFRTTPFSVGDVTEIPGLRVSVLRIDDEGRPRGVRYELDRDLDGDGVAWISEGRSGFSDVAPPPVGFGVRLGQ